jgi:hypothetical protein
MAHIRVKTKTRDIKSKKLFVGFRAWIKTAEAKMLLARVAASLAVVASLYLSSKAKVAKDDTDKIVEQWKRQSEWNELENEIKSKSKSYLGGFSKLAKKTKRGVKNIANKAMGKESQMTYKDFLEETE